MAETQGMVHPEAKFLFSCEPVKQDKLCDSKTKRGTGIGETFPFQKEEIGKKEGVTGPYLNTDGARCVPTYYLPYRLS